MSDAVVVQRTVLLNGEFKLQLIPGIWQLAT